MKTFAPPSSTSPSETNAQFISPKKDDRFVPNRQFTNMDLVNYCVINRGKWSTRFKSKRRHSSNDEYNKHLPRVLFSSTESPQDMRMLKFHNEPSQAKSPRPVRSRPKLKPMPKKPVLVLDAPDSTGIESRTSSKLLDWNCTNVLAIALGKSVHLWNSTSGTRSKIIELQNDKIRSLAWASDGQHLAISSQNDERVQIWNTSPVRQLRHLGGHSSLISSLDWNSNLVSSGGSDCKIINHDVRSSRPVTSEIKAHSGHVSCLKWSPSMRQILASGSTDTLAKIWDLRFVSKFQCMHAFDSMKSRVVDLAWCPFQSNVLACAGDSGDASIRFGNIQTKTWFGNIQTEASPVNGILWNEHRRELLSSHGGQSSGFNLWRYPSLQKTFNVSNSNSNSKIIQMAASSYTENRVVAALCTDETLRFWPLLSSPEPSHRTYDALPSSDDFVKFPKPSRLG